MSPDESPGFLLWRLTLRWQRAITAVLTPLDLTHVQFVLLASTWWLNGQGQRPNQLSVARHAETDVKMTSQVLRKLEEKGLLVREVDPADTRARLLRLTERGQQLAERAVATVEKADAGFFASIPDGTSMITALRRTVQ
ncbi:MarR family winged helix-turn-helix transcriptional regulator [Nonomuraea sediminis]|uniref:MarR family winged helix-turn-helix transcriptional regulator n=1 Tax=Nonomuraea sediminis TaxID=2835864 RepID=UPI001BDCC7F2|nr:winged helix DNA-binding protein [Nonomuraea sediminis]